MIKKAGCLVVAIGLLAASAAAAREGSMPYDALACKNKNIVLGFGGMMSKDDYPTFQQYLTNLTISGQCERILEGQSVTFTKSSGGGSCFTLETGQACFWAGVEF